MADLRPEFDPETEQDLREALRTRPAPEGFTRRMMLRAEAELAAPGPMDRLATSLARWFSLPALRFAAVAAVLIAVLAGTLAWQQQQRRVEGERARAQVLLALRITSLALHDVQQNLTPSNSPKEAQP